MIEGIPERIDHKYEGEEFFIRLEIDLISGSTVGRKGYVVIARL